MVSPGILVCKDPFFTNLQYNVTVISRWFLMHIFGQVCSNIFSMFSLLDIYGNLHQMPKRLNFYDNQIGNFF